MAYAKGYRVADDGSILNPRGKKLTGYIGSRGYRRFKYDRNKNDLDVHRLAAYQLFGNKLFEEGIEVRHLDGNALNNAKNNLAIGTASQNYFDKPLSVRLFVSNSGAQVLRKLTNIEIKEMRLKREHGASYKELMDKYGIAKSTVSYIINKKTYRD